MTLVTLERVHKSFGSHHVLRAASLEVEEGSLVALLGESGSGKTTMLRVLAGFERADAGRVQLAGRVVDDGRRFVPPERRRIGYVPQEGALFPHLTVGGNVMFALRATRTGGRAHRHGGRRQASLRVDEVLELVGLAPLRRRYPHELSGGQRQRVALARALAAQPELVLLDEPFASLDAALRASVRHEVVDVLRRAGATAVLVTHDQDEALSTADLVAVLRDGAIVQCEAPDVLYRRPVDPELARFVGQANLLHGVLRGAHVRCAVGEVPVGTMNGASAATPGGSRAVTVLIRPEQLEVDVVPGGIPRCDAPDVQGVVIEREFHGHDVVLTIRLSGPQQDTEIVARRAGWEAPAPGTSVSVRVTGHASVWSEN